MARKNSAIVDRELKGMSPSTRDNVKVIHAIHRLLYGALPTEDRLPNPDYSKCLVLTPYANHLLDEAGVELDEFPSGAVELGALLQFYYNDLLIDPDLSDTDHLLEVVRCDLSAGAYYWPANYGRAPYDRYHELFSNERKEYLEPEEVDRIFHGLGEGVYQVGRWLVGPLGIIQSEDDRFSPPFPSTPLWHCSDPGCSYVHHVYLNSHHSIADDIAEIFKQAGAATEGGSSSWDGAFDSLHRTENYSEGQRYSDIATFLFQAFSTTEIRALTEMALRTDKSSLLRPILEARYGSDFVKCDARVLANKLATDASIQLLLIPSARQLVGIVDDAVYSRAIKIPSTENRIGKFMPKPLSPYDERCELSALGMRSVGRSPNVSLVRRIWQSYHNAGILSDLAWKINANSGAFDVGDVIIYVRDKGPRAAVEHLILSTQPVFEDVRRELYLNQDILSRSEESIDRILWKFGFEPPRYDQTLDTLRKHLVELRDSVLLTDERLTERQQADIRSAGVNVFVLLEKILEQVVAFNVWVLASDHFVETRFDYYPDVAVQRLPETISIPGSLRETVPGWNPSGNNTLGTLLVYARAAAEWMKGLPGSDKAAYAHPEHELPHYAMSRETTFPFRHRQLWADLDLNRLQEFANAFGDLISHFEQSRLAEIRNALDHYREQEDFPSQELILACESRVSAALDLADAKGFYPKALWLSERRQAAFGSIEYVLSDYRGRKFQMYRPSLLSGLPTPTFNMAMVVPHGNLLAIPTGELFFEVKDRSEYARMWENYPVRVTDSNSEFDDRSTDVTEESSAGLSIPS